MNYKRSILISHVTSGISVYRMSDVIYKFIVLFDDRRNYNYGVITSDQTIEHETHAPNNI